MGLDDGDHDGEMRLGMHRRRGEQAILAFPTPMSRANDLRRPGFGWAYRRWKMRCSSYFAAHTIDRLGYDKFAVLRPAIGVSESYEVRHEGTVGLGGESSVRAV